MKRFDLNHRKPYTAKDGALGPWPSYYLQFLARGAFRSIAYFYQAHRPTDIAYHALEAEHGEEFLRSDPFSASRVTPNQIGIRRVKTKFQPLTLTIRSDGMPYIDASHIDCPSHGKLESDTKRVILSNPESKYRSITGQDALIFTCSHCVEPLGWLEFNQPILWGVPKYTAYLGHVDNSTHPNAASRLSDEEAFDLMAKMCLDIDRAAEVSGTPFSNVFDAASAHHQMSVLFQDGVFPGSPKATASLPRIMPFTMSLKAFRVLFEAGQHTRQMMLANKLLTLPRAFCDALGAFLGHMASLGAGDVLMYEVPDDPEGKDMGFGMPAAVVTVGSAPNRKLRCKRVIAFTPQGARRQKHQAMLVLQDKRGYYEEYVLDHPLTKETVYRLTIEKLHRQLGWVVDPMLEERR